MIKQPFETEDERFKVIFELVNAIDVHPFLKTSLEKDADTDRHYLPMCNICNDHVQAPNDFKELMMKLAVELDTKLITSAGQHSKAFYDLRRVGWLCQTGESDSFGPLSSILSPPHRAWFVCYG